MELNCLILFIMATVGLTHIIVDSDLFESLRNRLAKEDAKWLIQKLSKVASCYQCAGFWCGLLCGMTIISLNPLIILACGFASSWLATWSNTMLSYVEHLTEGK